MWLAHARVMRAEFREVASQLRALLGATLAAYLGSVGDTRAISQWAACERRAGAATQARLRLVLQVGLGISESTCGRRAGPGSRA
jgi:hypothetical protein